MRIANAAIEVEGFLIDGPGAVVVAVDIESVGAPLQKAGGQLDVPERMDGLEPLVRACEPMCEIPPAIVDE